MMQGFQANYGAAGTPRYLSVEGRIVNMEAVRMNNRQKQGFSVFAAVEDDKGNITNFMVTPMTYVTNFITLTEGMRVVFYYLADAPAVLIYPPQFGAAVAAPVQGDKSFVAVGYFNRFLINETQTLKLNLDHNVKILTVNNQKFLGSPAGHDLVVFYRNTTRSIPAQTTPEKIVVLGG